MLLLWSSLQQQLKYEMTGSNNALRYYYVDPLSGLVTLKRLLTDSSNTDDQVFGNHHTGHFFR